MNTFDLTRTAISNSFRSLSRTTLTVVAIFIGAFTLTLTNGVGNGVNAYIDSTVSALGATDVLTVTKTQGEPGDGPQKYDPNTSVTSNGEDGFQSGTVEAITPADVKQLQTIDGVRSVEPILSVRPNSVSYASGQPYQLVVGGFVPGTTIQLAAGSQLQRETTEYQIAIPSSYVVPLGFADPQDAIDKQVKLGVTDAGGKKSTITAKVVAVSEPGLTAGSSFTANSALTTALYDRQSIGMPAAAKNSYADATVRFDPAATPEQVTALQQRLTDAGYDSQTVEDQIGSFKTVIDTVVLILNGFAVIALLAAGFGIVNTLLMSVQERTREIGLMKAMGLGGGRIFALFSFEAVFIGLLGSAIGAASAITVGLVANNVLAGNLLADLPGLQLTAFSPASIGIIVAIVMGIAFLAGTIPALRAARQDPIESLRYE
jgi:putative ABC transport system permease protein